LEDQFEVANAAHAGDFGTKGVSDLGGEGADVAGCSINQNFAPRLNGRSVGVESAAAKSLKCGERCDGNGGRLLGDGRLLGAGELGEGPPQEPKTWSPSRNWRSQRQGALLRAIRA
jgi:hypothetical protein